MAAGKVVTYKFEGDKDDEAETFLLGARENEEYVEGLTVFSPQAPLGAALLGAETGSVVEFDRPQRPHQQGRDRLGEPVLGLTAPRELLDDPVAALAQPGQHLLGVLRAAGLQLQLHLDLVEQQAPARSARASPRARWRRSRPPR